MSRIYIDVCMYIREYIHICKYVYIHLYIVYLYASSWFFLSISIYQSLRIWKCSDLGDWSATSCHYFIRWIPYIEIDVCVCCVYFIDEGSNHINFFIDGVIAISELSPNGGVIVGTDHLAAVSFHPPLHAPHEHTYPAHAYIICAISILEYVICRTLRLNKTNKHTRKSTCTHKCAFVYMWC